MPLHPDDVVRKTFRTAQFRRGYDDKEVDAFLQEVEAELRRLYARVDELEAEVTQREQRGQGDRESERVRLERQQLELVRAERAGLVDELRTLQAQIDERRAGSISSPPLGTGDTRNPQSDGDRLRLQVEWLQAERERLTSQQGHYRETIIASAREHLNLLEDGGTRP